VLAMAQRSACYSHLLLHLVAGLRCGHCQLSNHHDDVSLNKTRHKRLKDSQFHNFATASRTLQSTFGSCVRSNGQDHGQATMRESGTGAHRARPGVHVPHQRRASIALMVLMRASQRRCCSCRGPAVGDGLLRLAWGLGETLKRMRAVVDACVAASQLLAATSWY